MPSAKFEPSTHKLVLVEGREEELLFGAVLKGLGLRGIEVKSYGGKDNLGPFLKALVAASAFRRLVGSLGITRDADESAENAFRSVTGALDRAKLQSPSRPGEKSQGRPVVSVLILPDNARPGMLEDVCLESVQDDPVIPCVDKLFDCVEHVGQPLPSNMSKARVYAYLATRAEPGRRIGETAGSGTWPFELSAFEPLRRFLGSL